MLTILLGCIIGSIMLAVSDHVEKKRTENILYAGGIVVFFLFGFTSICVPTKYQDRKFEGIIQIDVLQVYNKIESDKLALVEEEMDIKSTYKYEGEIQGYIVTEIIEHYSFEIPELVQYVRKPKISIWTLGVLGYEKEEYILYLPKGAIEEEVFR